MARSEERKYMNKNNKKKSFIGIIIYIAVLLLAVGGGIATGLFQSVSQAFEGFNIDGQACIRVIVMACIVLVIQNLLLMVLGSLHFKKNRSNTIVTILSSVIRYAAILIIICWGLTLMGVNVETVVASVGLIALVIGFGAESLIEDVITGLFMLFENQYNVDDIVEVDGFRGTVTNIGIRTTALTDVGGNIKIINNSNMKDILNRSNNVSRAIAEIGVPYEIDIEAFEEEIPKIMDEIYKLHTDKMKAAPIYLGISELAASSVVMKFAVEVDEADIYSTQRILNRELLVLFKKAGVSVPFPQMDIHQK